MIYSFCITCKIKHQQINKEEEVGFIPGYLETHMSVVGVTNIKAD